MAAPLLELRNLTKSFGAVRALKGVSFELTAGEVHALLGENGAGKSTLIKIITGAHHPDSGSISINGQPLHKLTPASARAHGVACIYQQPALFPDLSVAENMALGLEPPSLLRRVRWKEHRKRAAELLKRVGAAIDPDAEVRGLSMPEQQLVEMAKALGAGARILILDEPTASLTTQEVQLLLSVMNDLRAHGVGLIYISHRLEEIFQVADRVTVLRDGESVGTQAVGEVTEASLIQRMVGREVAAIYPPSEGSPGAPVLSVHGLGCSASGVRDVNLEIRAGEILGLAGLVGAGRTELARILFGITPGETGSIRLNGREVTIRSPRDAVEAGISYVPEDRRRHGVIQDMTIAENVSMGIHSRIFPRAWLRFGAERELASGYMREFAVKAPSFETRVASLSGGNQQKVALSRWLAARPKVLVLDEPTQGVDVGAKAEIHKLMRRLASDGLAVLLISSDLPEILGMSDRIAVMRKGTVVTEFSREACDAQRIMGAALGQMEKGVPAC